MSMNGEIVSLLDIGELASKVEIRGKSIKVVGLSGEHIVSLMQRFPQVREMMAGRTGALSPEGIMALTGEAIGAVIAAGTEAAGNAQAEQAARGLSVGEQAALIGAIFELSFPFGMEAFISTIESLGGALVGSGASGWDQGTKSQKLSKGSSPPATGGP